MKKFSFEKLNVWKLSKNFSIDIYKVTNSFPTEEKFGLTSQIRRASISISSNIAEGSTRTSSADQRRFYNFAFSSATEVLNQLILSYELGFIPEFTYKKLRKKVESITAMLNRLHDSTNA